ncbi:hypothetical protein M9Y10_022375 [Tritrichomonas musculus]|uniref:SOSS complex subunit A homolog n=1 Tax=Tritrichomonas musculus TaxID=1915356 RepID=A0ABR2KT36_9EUKA
MESGIKGKFINFRRIGFEFRRIDKNNSPIITAALVINQSLINQSAKLDEIIKSREYQNLLRLSVIFYRRFESDPISHFNNLITLVNWSSGVHLGEYVFIQIILAIPNISISGEQIRSVCKMFPTLFEPIFISRIYSNAKLLFPDCTPELQSNQLVNADYLKKCGADDYLIEQFLTLTFSPSFDFFRQICESQRYQILLGLLSLRPEFFLTIENICRSDLFEVISQIMSSGNQTFLNIFFSNYQKIPSSIIKCVCNIINASILNQYAKDLDKQRFQNLFNFLFQNEVTEMIQDGITFNDNFVPCLHDLYQRNPDLVFKIFKKTNNQVLNSTIGSIVTSFYDNLYAMPFPLIDAVLSKPEFALEIQKGYPHFFSFVLNRYPSCAMAISEIIKKMQRKCTPPEDHFYPPNEKGSGRPPPKFKRSFVQSMIQKPNDYNNNRNYSADQFDDDDVEEFQMKNSGDNGIIEASPIDNLNQLLKLIYEINEEAYCRCILPKSNSVLNLLLNFVPTPQNRIPDSLSGMSNPPDVAQTSKHHINYKNNLNQNINTNRNRTPNPPDNNNNDNDKYRLNSSNDSNENNKNNTNSRYRPKNSSNNNNNENIIRSNILIDKDKNTRRPINISINDKKIKRTVSDPNRDKVIQDQPQPISILINKSSSQDISLKESKQSQPQPNNENDNNNNNDQNVNSEDANSETPNKTDDNSDFIINPSHLHFPSHNFFTVCEQNVIIPQEDLTIFFNDFIYYIVDDSRWMSAISQSPLLFYQFTKVLFRKEELSKYNLPITINFANYMYSAFLSNREKFVAFTEFLLNNQFFVRIDNFPLFLKIKLLSLISNFLGNRIEPCINLFMLIVKDYRCLIALDTVSKNNFLNALIRNNLDDPNCHRAFIMAYDNHYDLIEPFNYIDSILKNKDAVATTLSYDESYFEKWYNLVIRNQSNPVMQIVNNSMRGGENSLDHFAVLELFRTVMINALSYPKFQNDLDFLSLLCQFLNPRSSIYNINPNNNEGPEGNRPIHSFPLNISKEALKIVIRNKRENPQTEKTEKYNLIYNVFITYYQNEIFRAIPIPQSFIEDTQTVAPR